jgi:neutral ceramidase
MNRYLQIAAVLSLFVFSSLASAADWQVGLGKENITPEKLMWMAGYGARTKPAEGKLTDLWAKAILLQDEQGNRALAITLDLVGIDRGLSQAIRAGIEKEHGLPREQIALLTSHTHSGPVVSKNLRPMHEYLLPDDQKALIAEYAQKLERQLINLAGSAIKDLQPAKVSWTTGRATFAVNRRTNRESEVPQLKQEGKILGPSDHDLPVLAVHSPKGDLRAVLFGYACHATVLAGYEWNGDWPGFAQIEIEKRHPGCLALFWAGCGADQNPQPMVSMPL